MIRKNNVFFELTLWCLVFYVLCFIAKLILLNPFCFLAGDGELLLGVPKVKLIRNDRREGTKMACSMQPDLAFCSLLLLS